MSDWLSSDTNKIEDVDKILADYTMVATVWDAVVEVVEDKKCENDDAYDAAMVKQEQL